MAAARCPWLNGPSAHGVSINFVRNCFHQLHQAGHIWLADLPGQYIYGTVAGLWQQMVVAASTANDQELRRLKDILRTYAVYAAHDEPPIFFHVLGAKMHLMWCKNAPNPVHY